MPSQMSVMPCQRECQRKKIMPCQRKYLRTEPHMSAESTIDLAINTIHMRIIHTD